MKMTRRTALKATASAVGLLAAGANVVRAQTTVFNYKVATNVPVTHPIYVRLNEATEKIKAETNGKVDIRVFPNGQLGSDTDLLSQVRSGSLEFLTLPGVVLANLVPMASLNSVGFAFRDYPSVWKAMDGDLGQYIRNHIEKTNLHVFDKVWDNGFRHITSNKPIGAPEDLVSMKIRVPVSPLLLSIFKSLKAAPTPINFNELYSALQTRIVDGQENPFPIIDTAKLYEVQKYCAMTSHAWDGYWLLANKKSFAALPLPLQEIVSRNFNAAGVSQRTDSEKLAADLQQKLASKGLTFSKPSTDRFRQALQQGGFYKEWKTKFGEEAWAHLESAVGKLT
ncbi:ABC transporter substrate-binding protein [Herbaspirillum hiltneri N3]|uniref:ABC transporter substrate-binding protein n=1 Tax=Herbaspirillum hiltneri N3 TaxID=1262470 RepID=A0ABN4HTK3_9BURK|nr:TRAP transporter substrate-binding protein [Herbaspirillum hiltneri]AKZ62305.1 ABC transporter substrate-binding protein [Herbaspirillum hiltneri N3]